MNIERVDYDHTAGDDDKDPGTNEKVPGCGRDIMTSNSRNLELVTGHVDRHRGLFPSPASST